MVSQFLLSMVVVSLVISGQSFAAKFEIQDLSQRNLLTFVSEAPLEKVMAQCSLFRGIVELEPLKLESGVQGEIEVDLRSCQSGSGLRDVLLQEQILDNKQYPFASIKLKKWAQEVKGSLAEDSTLTFLVGIEINYRGKTTSLPVPVKLRYFKESEKTRQRLPGNLLRISSQIDLDLAHLGISVPEKLKSVFANRVEAVFDAVGSDRLPSEKSVLPEGAKPKERS